MATPPLAKYTYKDLNNTVYIFCGSRHLTNIRNKKKREIERKERNAYIYIYTNRILNVARRSLQRRPQEVKKNSRSSTYIYNYSINLYTFLCASSLYRDRDAVYNAFLYHHVCRAAATPAGVKIQLRLCARSLFFVLFTAR